MYVQVSPVRVNVDVPSIVWLTAFLPHVAAAVASASADSSSTYMDVRSEVIMPKVRNEAWLGYWLVE